MASFPFSFPAATAPASATGVDSQKPAFTLPPKVTHAQAYDAILQPASPPLRDRPEEAARRALECAEALAGSVQGESFGWHRRQKREGLLDDQLAILSSRLRGSSLQLIQGFRLDHMSNSPGFSAMVEFAFISSAAIPVCKNACNKNAATGGGLAVSDTMKIRPGSNGTHLSRGAVSFTVGDFFELVAGFGEQLIGFGASFFGSRFSSFRA